MPTSPVRKKHPFVLQRLRIVAEVGMLHKKSHKLAQSLVLSSCGEIKLSPSLRSVKMHVPSKERMDSYSRRVPHLQDQIMHRVSAPLSF